MGQPEHLIDPRDLPEGFSVPRWDHPLDVDVWFKLVPEDATVKGVFFNRLMKEVRENGGELPEQTKHYDFTNYPLRDLMRLLLDASKILHPEASQRQALREMAWMGYGTLSDTLIGKVIFGAMGNNPGKVFSLAAKAMENAASTAKIKALEVSDHHAVLHVWETYLFPECFSVGMTEGVLMSCKRKGFVASRIQSPTELDVYVHWE